MIQNILKYTVLLVDIHITFLYISQTNLCISFKDCMPFGKSSDYSLPQKLQYSTTMSERELREIINALTCFPVR